VPVQRPGDQCGEENERSDEVGDFHDGFPLRCAGNTVDPSSVPIDTSCQETNVRDKSQGIMLDEGSGTAVG
jgi:hypothetical protein